MADDPLRTPVVVDGIVSAEKLAELLALQTEYPELDYKRRLDISVRAELIELAAHVGAMNVRGGYILIGVDGDGVPTGDMDKIDTQLFDEANLKPKLLRYLPPSLELRTNVLEREGHQVVVICVHPNPAGCAIFNTDGAYQRDDGEEVVVFRAGDIFWRDGTRSMRISEQGLEEVVRRRVAAEKETWLADQEEIRRRERRELQEAAESRRLGEGPLGSVSLDLDPEQLNLAALELIRRGDTIAMRHLFVDALARARGMIERGALEDELADLLDKLICLAAAFLDYEQGKWLDEVIAALVQIYALGFEDHEPRWFDHRTQISPDEVGPRVWLLIIERVFALGALAVRREQWDAVSRLTLQLPKQLEEDGYYKNWLRHALTMASRATQFERRGEGEQLSLLSLARQVAGRLACLRSDGLDANADELLSSAAQFDLLAGLAAIADARTVRGGQVYYTNFARFYQERVQPIANRLLADQELRDAIFPLGNDDLAIAFNDMGHWARQEGWRYDGFMGWDQSPVQAFIDEHLPEPPEGEGSQPPTA